VGLFESVICQKFLASGFGQISNLPKIFGNWVCVLARFDDFAKNGLSIFGNLPFLKQKWQPLFPWNCNEKSIHLPFVTLFY
jgi:hypothetical protein